MAHPTDTEVESDIEAAGGSASQTTAATPVGSEEESASHPEADKSMCAWLFDTIIMHASNSHAAAPMPQSVLKLSKRNVTAPFFVTWMKQNSLGEYHLRGCIGTQRALPIEKLRNYAIFSAFEDSRFQPVEAAEIPRLKCHVSLLHSFESAENPFDWTIGIHGVTIDFMANGRRYSATYLPEVAKEMNMTKKECLTSLIKKAGYYGEINDKFINDLRLTRYQSSQARLKYDDYIKTFGSLESRMK